jgi:hypothetical protein
MTYWHDPTYLNKYLSVVAADPEAAANNYFFDAISLHIYFRPETIRTIVGNAFYVQQINGISPMKEVWINETNARPSMDPEWPVEVQAFQIDLEQQAWYIVQAFATGFYAGAARISVYKLVDINMSPGDESWGLIRPYDFSKRPAFFAYQNTVKYLHGFTYPIQKEETANYVIYTFTRANGTTTRVMWARTARGVTLQLPALAGQGVLVDPVTGAEQPLQPVNGAYTVNLAGARCYSECYLGGAPFMLVEEATGGNVPQAAATPDAPPATPTQPAVDPTGSPTAPVSGTATPTSVPATKTPPPPPTPTETATLTPSPTPTVTATASPTQTPTPTATSSPAATGTPSQTAVAPVAGTAVAAQPATVVEAVETPSDAPTAAAGQGRGSASWFFFAGAFFLAAALFYFSRRAR